MGKGDPNKSNVEIMALITCEYDGLQLVSSLFKKNKNKCLNTLKSLE